MRIKSGSSTTFADTSEIGSGNLFIFKEVFLQDTLAAKPGELEFCVGVKIFTSASTSPAMSSWLYSVLCLAGSAEPSVESNGTFSALTETSYVGWFVS